MKRNNVKRGMIMSRNNINKIKEIIRENLPSNYLKEKVIPFTVIYFTFKKSGETSWKFGLEEIKDSLIELRDDGFLPNFMALEISGGGNFENEVELESEEKSKRKIK